MLFPVIPSAQRDNIRLFNIIKIICETTNTGWVGFLLCMVITQNHLMHEQDIMKHNKNLWCSLRFIGRKTNTLMCFGFSGIY